MRGSNWYSTRFPVATNSVNRLACTPSRYCCISDGPTAALIASSAQWKTLINIGLLMGVLAGALGNYVGIGVAYAIHAFIGA